MKLHGPRGKIARALGIAITPKTARILERRPTRPGQHGAAPSRKASDYKRQLLEKQRLRAQYAIGERQLRNAFEKASRLGGNTGERLLQLLECRLDVVVLRAGFARTIYAARQLVSHGHIEVDGARCTAPSRVLEPADTVSLRERSRDHPSVVAALEARPPRFEHLEVDAEKRRARLVAVPHRDLIPVICETSLVVEFYSR